MKKRISALFGMVLFASLILVGCNSSVKGKWSDSDKQKFYKDMSTVEELSVFGEDKPKWIECYLSKCEATYSSYREADADMQGCEKIAGECRKEVLSNGSVKGKWSEADKQQFHTDMGEVESLSNFGEDKDAWVECYLSKLEANYSSYNEANTDSDGCKKIARECSAEIGISK